LNIKNSGGAENGQDIKEVERNHFKREGRKRLNLKIKNSSATR
jgi:hypothetical protein